MLKCLITSCILCRDTISFLGEISQRLRYCGEIVYESFEELYQAQELWQLHKILRSRTVFNYFYLRWIYSNIVLPSK